MTDHASLLRQIRQDARPYVEQWLDLSEVFTGFRKLASDNGLDWGVIKALIKAEVQDEKEGGSIKVDRIIEKADFAASYADMLGLGTAKMNEDNFSSAQAGVAVTRSLNVASEEGAGPFAPSSSLPPHDEDGVLTEEPALTNDDIAEIQAVARERIDKYLEIEPARVVPAVGDAVSRASTGSLPGHAASPTRPDGEPIITNPASPPEAEQEADPRPAVTGSASINSDDPGPIPDFLRRVA